jgi:DNA-binding NarL/FixJ family response regulator
MLDPYEMERLEQAIFRLWWDLGDRDSIRAMLEHYRGRLAVQCDGIEDALALLARLESLGETSPSAQDERIIALWREGFTGTDIAGRLSLAPGTVQNRVVQLRHSLGEVQVPYHR